MIGIRPGTLAEIDRLQLVEREASSRFADLGMTEIAEGEPTNRTVLADRIQAGELLVAVNAADEPVAFTIFTRVDGVCYIEEIDVLSSYRGKRVGARLIDEVAKISRTRDLPAVVLSTFRHVPWNKPHYERLGFQEMALDALSQGLMHYESSMRDKALEAQGPRLFMIRAVQVS